MFFFLTFAYANCPDAQEYLSLAQKTLLEGSLDEAQVNLSLVRSSAHCRVFSNSEFHHYLYLRGVYHYLRKENQLAERYFKRSSHPVELNFGERMKSFYQRFPKESATVPIVIHHSRFQALHLNGTSSASKLFLPAGPQLLQLLHDNQLTFSTWIELDSGQNPEYTLPRSTSKNWLYAAAGSGVLSVVSIWQAVEQNQNMIEATSEAELKQARQNQFLWSGSAIGFGVVTTTLIGIYLYW